MKLGVLSDTHDNTPAIAAAMRMFQDRGVSCLIHCGDLTSPGTAAKFRSIPTHFVLGNCDGPIELLKPAIHSASGTIHESVGSMVVSGCRIAWTHGHEWSRLLELELSGEFDFVFHGHTHKAEQYRRGKTWIVNPGALYRAASYTCVVLDVTSGSVEFVEVSPEGTTTTF